MMLGPLADEPRRVGKPLVGELAGLWSARRGDYRVAMKSMMTPSSFLYTECNIVGTFIGHGDDRCWGSRSA